MSGTDIFAALRAAADPERAEQMKAYMRSQFQFLGIPTPERRRLSRDCLKELSKRAVDWEFVAKCWAQPEREFQYLALDYLVKIKTQLPPAAVPKLREIALSKSWWDTIDFIDGVIGDIALRHPEVNATLLEWSLDDNFWLRRIAIDHQRARKDKTDVVLLEQIIVNNLGQTEFFVNKAIGWSLREYAKTNPDWVRGFITRHRHLMAPLSVREAGKHLQ
jgi:3-methyladenine DNA glycosylase AlkD